MNESKILGWTLDLSESPSFETNEINEELLFKYIVGHKLETKFFEKIKKNKPLWCSDKVYIKAESLAEQIKKRFEDQHSFLTSFSEEYESTLLVIKGFTAFLLTDKETPIRGSSDMDLFTEDYVKLREKLITTGFVEVKSETGHEFSELVKNSINVDIHKLYPIYQYPKDIWDMQLNVVNLTTSESIQIVSEIYYEDLVQNCIYIHKNLAVPSVEMAILILSNNLFKDYVSFLDFLPPVPLVQIVEIVQLLKKTDIGRVYKLAEKYNASQLLDFVGEVISKLYGLNPFENFTGQPKPGFPQMLLWNFNTWINNNQTNKLLKTIDLKNIISEMKNTMLKSSSHTKIYKYQNIDKNLENSLNGYEGTTGRKVDVALQVIWEDCIHFQIDIFNTKLSMNDMVVINFGTFRRIYLGDKLINAVTYSVAEDRSSLSVEINANEFPEILTSQTLALLLFVEKKDPGDIRSSLFPIILNKQ